MSVFRSIVFSAVLAGVVAGAATTAVQMFGTVKLIQQAEVYEKKAEAPAPAATPAPAPAASGHDHGGHQHAAAAHDHGGAWEPEEGFQRNAFTAGANVLTAIGFALLLAGIFALRGRPVDWREGLFWGLDGFVVFVASPGLGLPPEVPGSEDINPLNIAPNGDPDKARQLLPQAGYPDGVPIKLLYTDEQEGRTLAALLQEMLGDSGFDVELVFAQRNAFYGDYLLNHEFT
jgi:hypothetical protein